MTGALSIDFMGISYSYNINWIKQLKGKKVLLAFVLNIFL